MSEGETGHVSASVPIISLNPFSSEYSYDQLHGLRSAVGPVAYDRAIDMWIVSGYDEVCQILMDPVSFSSGGASHTPVFPLCEEAAIILRAANGGRDRPPSVSSVDGAAHARLRRPLVKSLGAKKIHNIRGQILEDCSALIGSLPRDRPFDLVREFVQPLTANFIFELIGFPRVDHSRLKFWCSKRLDLTWGFLQQEDQVKAANDLSDYYEYCRNFVESRRMHPNDDLTSDLLRHVDDGDSLMDDEVAALVTSLSFAGHETTARLISNVVVRLLLRDGYEWTRMQSRPTLLIRAIEESLRMDGPIVTWQRTSTKDVCVGNIQIPANRRVLLVLASVGRDARHTADVDIFEVERDRSIHLSFGRGIHYCPGASLARTQAEVGIASLIAAMPCLRMVPDSTLEYPRNLAFRGPRELWVRYMAS